uniref:Smr domain-containing protein n=2 Tax=Proboscia inermis TaxID=420281 RepID=A0A7S0C1X0_9STRA|mmetsp:Transcript_21786/g.22156  ORF Transcript_21786/g.22156 Transcript_21786/m.22156 type:complete len:102 (+) Transcript_21786:65-370(+)
MGKINENGNLYVDFHGLYLKEAILKFNEVVLPILPVQEKIIVITGRGLHNKNGRSVLRDGLLAHINTKSTSKIGCIQCKIDPRNQGALNVTWVFFREDVIH